MEGAFFSRLLKLARRAGWAPAAVMVFHELIADTVWRVPLDFMVHFLGGASTSYLMVCALEIFSTWTGLLHRPARFVFSFALTCTVGLMWEFAEFYRDNVNHTHIQQGLEETMSDLIADSTGAVTCLVLLYGLRVLTLRPKGDKRID